jgi:hypothetical protein
MKAKKIAAATKLALRVNPLLTRQSILAKDEILAFCRETPTYLGCFQL